MENTIILTITRRLSGWVLLSCCLGLSILLLQQFSSAINVTWWPDDASHELPSWVWGAGFATLVSSLLLLIRFGVNQIRREEQLKLEFERRLSKVEMGALRSQMNPHFIFNCLNSIDYYILKNETEMASDYLNRFSRLIRLILQNSRKNQVNLKDELEALRLYIEMETLRFQGQFVYTIQIKNGLIPVDHEIPPMLLQPYVENAIWHGLLHSDEPGRIDIILALEGHQLMCVIQDNGVGRDFVQQMNASSKLKTRSMGTKITEDRLELFSKLYHHEASVQIIDLTDKNGKARGTRVELSIPVH